MRPHTRVTPPGILYWITAMFFVWDRFHWLFADGAGLSIRRSLPVILAVAFFELPQIGRFAIKQE